MGYSTRLGPNNRLGQGRGMRYVYHLGAHKTASTLIQKNLSANLQVLRDRRVYYVNAEMPNVIRKQRKVLRRARMPGHETPPENALAAVNARIEEAARQAGAGMILLSEENRLGPPMHQELAWGLPKPGFYPAAEACLRYVTHGQALDNTRFVLFSRDPDAFVLSLYSEAVRMAQTTLDIDAFCAAIDLQSVDFAALERRLRGLHPQLEVIQRPFEAIRNGATPFLEQFLGDLGLDPGGFAINTELTRSQLDKNQVDDLLQLARSGKFEGRPMRLRQQQRRILTRGSGGGAPLQLPDWARAQLAPGRLEDGAALT